MVSVSLRGQNRPNLRTGSGGEGPGSEASEEPENRPKPHMPQTVSQTSGNSPGFPGRTGPKSLCEQYREMIAVKLDQGLSPAVQPQSRLH